MPPFTLYIDADACPVKSQVFRVAERFIARGTALKAVAVSIATKAIPPRHQIAGLKNDATNRPSATAAISQGQYLIGMKAKSSAPGAVRLR
jgi:hypothetical protein